MAQGELYNIGSVSSQTISGGNIKGTLIATEGTSINLEYVNSGNQLFNLLSSGNEYSDAYTERGSQIAGDDLSWDGDLNVEDNFLRNHEDDSTSGILTAGGFTTVGHISSAIISSSVYIGGLHYPADYIFYKDGSTYYGKNAMTGKLDFSDTDCATALNATLHENLLVFVPSGIYKISSTIYLKDGSYIGGSGRGTEFRIVDNGVTGFEFSSTADARISHMYMRPDTNLYSGSMVKFSAYSGNTSLYNRAHDLMLDGYYNVKSGNAIHFYATGATNTYTYSLDNACSNIRTRRTDRGIYIEREGGAGTGTNKGCYINNNRFENIWIGTAKTAAVEFVGTGSRISRNYFSNVKCQANWQTLDGFKNIDGTANSFLDCVVWDFVTASGNNVWSITDEATDTYIDTSLGSSNSYDSGSRTWGFWRSYTGYLNAFRIRNVSKIHARDGEDIYINNYDDTYGIRIRNNGNIHINSPTVQLQDTTSLLFDGDGTHFISHKNDTPASDKIQFRFSGNTDVLTVHQTSDKQSRVGIGDTTPAYELQVNGSIYGTVVSGGKFHGHTVSGASDIEDGGSSWNSVRWKNSGIQWNDSNAQWEPVNIMGGAGLSDVVDDTSPQLGGSLDGQDTYGIYDITGFSSARISSTRIRGHTFSGMARIEAPGDLNFYAKDYYIFRSGSTRIFSINKVRDRVYLTGESGGGKTLTLQASTTDTYPYFRLSGGGWINACIEDGSYFKIRDKSNVQLFKFEGTGQLSTFYGGGDTADSLKILANDNVDAPYLMLSGNNSDSIGINTMSPNYTFEVNGNLYATTISGGNLPGKYYPSSIGVGHSGNADIHYPSSNLRGWLGGVYAPTGTTGTGYWFSSNGLYYPHEIRVAHSGWDMGIYNLQVSGDAYISGIVKFKGNIISGLADPTFASGAASKHYVDNALSSSRFKDQAGILVNHDVDGYIKLSGQGATYVRSGQNMFLISSSAGSNPGGSDTQVQFNDSSSFGGDSALTWNKTTNTLDIGGALSSQAISGGQLLMTTRVTDILDEDSMESDSATALATQQSIKSFINTVSSNLDTRIDAVSDTPSTWTDMTTGTGLTPITVGVSGSAGTTVNVLGYSIISSNAHEMAASGIKYTQAYTWYNNSSQQISAYVASGDEYSTAYTERGSQIAGDNLNWDGSELDVQNVLVDNADDTTTGIITAGGFTTTAGISGANVSGGTIRTMKISSATTININSASNIDIHSAGNITLDTNANFYVKEQGDQIIYVRQLGSDTWLYGGDSAGADLFLIANDSDATPYIRLKGNDAIYVEGKFEHISSQAISGAWTTPLYQSKPTADASNCGQMIRVSGGTGEKTWVFMSVKNDANGYEWIQLAVST